MTLNINVPHISVTAETEDDDEHHLLSLAEVLTDIEDLSDEAPSSNTVNVKKSKLKIILDPDQNACTDLEDFEASENEEDDNKIAYHENPISLDQLDMEDGTYHEINNSRDWKKSKTNSMDGKSGRQNLIEECKTEVESDCTDEDLEAEQIVTEAPLAKFLAVMGDTAFVSVQNKVTKEVVPKNRRQAQNGHTDVECLLSDDSNDEIQVKKNKPRRKKRSTKLCVSDEEYLEFSDDNEARYKNVEKKVGKPPAFTRSHSLANDSDDENTQLPFPLCKKVAKKITLKLPEFDKAALTDVEDMEDDDDDAISDNPIEEGTDVLTLLDDEYHVDSDKSSLVNKGHYAIRDVQESSDVKQNQTDSEGYDTDDQEKVNTITSPKEEIKLRFVKNAKKVKLATRMHRQRTMGYESDNDNYTDAEDVDSDQSDGGFTVALVRNDSTDEEDFTSDVNIMSNRLRDLKLPAPIRNMIILKEQKDQAPFVKILPLIEDDDADKSDAKEDHVTTDEENFDSDHTNDDDDEDNHDSMEEVNTDILMYDGGSVSNVEKSTSNHHLNVDNASDGLTDTEEYVLDKPRKKKHPTFKSMMAKSPKVGLSPPQQNQDDLTDAEEIYFSDTNQEEPPQINQPLNENLTDTEYVDGDAPNDDYRSFSCTPIHMRELSGENVMLRDGLGPFTQTDRLYVNKKILNVDNIVYTPLGTDTEDLLGSGEEDTYSRAQTATPIHVHATLDNSSLSKVHSSTRKKIDQDAPDEVMYLKGGGGFFESNATDIEEIDWDADQKPTELQSVSGSTKLDAAPQGYEATSSVPSDAASTSKDQTGEKQTDDKESRVSDQHQLSKEMQELLAELEKQTEH